MFAQFKYASTCQAHSVDSALHRRAYSYHHCYRNSLLTSCATTLSICETANVLLTRSEKCTFHVMTMSGRSTAYFVGLSMGEKGGRGGINGGGGINYTCSHFISVRIGCELILAVCQYFSAALFSLTLSASPSCRRASRHRSWLRFSMTSLLALTRWRRCVNLKLVFIACVNKWHPASLVVVTANNCLTLAFANVCTLVDYCTPKMV